MARAAACRPQSKKNLLSALDRVNTPLCSKDSRKRTIAYLKTSLEDSTALQLNLSLVNYRVLQTLKTPSIPELQPLYHHCTNHHQRRSAPVTKPNFLLLLIPGKMYYSKPRSRRESDAPDTHGTYIYDIHPQDRRSYHAQDPTRCNCRCCPHPRLRSDGASSATRPDSSPRHNSLAYAARHHTSEGYSKFSRHCADGRDYYRNSHGPGKDDTYMSANGRESDYRPSAYSPAYKPKKTRRHDEHHRIIVDVVDRTLSQDLRAQYGRCFPLAISLRTTTVQDVSRFLAPDSRREHVVVRWKNGEVEPLDNLVPLSDLQSQETRLEVRTRKRVHWS